MDMQNSEGGAQFRSLANQLPVLVWSTDHDLCVTSVGGGGLAALGQRPDELVGLSLPEYMGPAYADVVFNAHRRALLGELSKYEAEWRGRWYETHVGPLRAANGEIIGALGMAIDVTERRHAEDERARLQERLRRQHKLEAIGQLASGLAHEINNPLQSILNFAQLIRARTQDEAAREYADGIAHEVQGLGGIVRNLQALVHQKAELPVELRLDELVQGTVSLFGAMLRKDGIMLDVDVAKDLRPAWGNAYGVQQVLINLLMVARDSVVRAALDDAALKRISLRATTIAGEGRSVVRVTIEHHEPPAQREPLRDTTRSDASQTTPLELGLSISQEMAHFNAGELTIEGGSERRAFHLILPLASDQ